TTMQKNNKLFSLLKIYRG
ncbi:hypothetical protein D041_3849, partial [Vibrio parahaemolyticus EKP-008]